MKVLKTGYKVLFVSLLLCFFALGCNNENEFETQNDYVLSYDNQTVALSGVFSCTLSEVSKIETYRGVLYSSPKRFESEEDIKDFFVVLFGSSNNVIAFSRTQEFEGTDFDRFKLFNTSITIYKTSQENSVGKIFEFFVVKETSQAYFEQEQDIFVATIQNVNELFDKYI